MITIYTKTKDNNNNIKNEIHYFTNVYLFDCFSNTIFSLSFRFFRFLFSPLLSRYMDPSLMAGEGYTLKADVYSFGIILYEICSLIVAYGKINNYPSLKAFNLVLVEHNLRPKLTRIACPLTRTLIKDCWQNDPNERPSFKEIYQRMKGILTIVEL
jgi:serine/threonine protein kinase